MSTDNILELSFNIEDLLGGKRSARVKQEYLKEGTAFYRVLPSFNPVDRRISNEFYVHWLKNGDGEGGDVKAICTRGTEGYCPLCEASIEQKNQAERAKMNGADPIRVKLLEEAGRNLSASKAIYFNVVNTANETVVLQLNSTVVGLLVKKFQQAISLGFDPVNMKTGIWFRFTKRGKGRDSVEVDFKKLQVAHEGELLEKNDRTSLSDELIDRLPTSVSTLANPDDFYLQQFTSKELSDHLRGTPLKNKFQKRVKAEANAQTVSEPEEHFYPVASSAPTVNASASSSPAAEANRIRNLSKSK